MSSTRIEWKRWIMLCVVLLSFLCPIEVQATEKIDNGKLVIALDPGHGGEENGANYYGIEEKDINLKLAILVYEELQEYQGVNVMLTREGDEEISLWERANRASAAGADILLSMHFNASVSHESNGASVYLSTGEANKASLMRLGDHFLGEFEAIGLENAGMFARVTQMNGRREDGTFDDYYGVLRHSYNMGIPAMIVEHCYMDSEVDKEYFYTEEGLEQLAKADANAIASYYGLCKPGGEVPEAKHATVFGVTTKAVEQGYFDAPRLNAITLKVYDGKTPGVATYEVDVEDGVGISMIYLVYKNVADGTSFTIYPRLEETLSDGVHEITVYFPTKLSLGQCHLSYVGVYNAVGLDAGYNRYYGTMVGYGKCDWLNTFSYSGEADIEIVEQTDISPYKTDYIIEQLRERIRSVRRPFEFPVTVKLPRH